MGLPVGDDGSDARGLLQCEILPVESGKALATLSKSAGRDVLYVRPLRYWTRLERELRRNGHERFRSQADEILVALERAARLRHATVVALLLEIRLDRARVSIRRQRQASPLRTYLTTPDGKSLGVITDSSLGHYFIVKGIDQWSAEEAEHRGRGHAVNSSIADMIHDGIGQAAHVREARRTLEEAAIANEFPRQAPQIARDAQEWRGARSDTSAASPAIRQAPRARMMWWRLLWVFSRPLIWLVYALIGEPPPWRRR
ncbi:MAG: hypothetical protein ABI906_03060 [Pseudomonadota bacterium]